MNDEWEGNVMAPRAAVANHSMPVRPVGECVRYLKMVEVRAEISNRSQRLGLADCTMQTKMVGPEGLEPPTKRL